MNNAPSFFARLSLAFAVLGDSTLAAKVQDVRNGVEPAAPPAPPAPPPPPVLKVATPDAALQLLGLLQREARFVDFVQEDVAAYSDADIGGAARLVHTGCRKVLQEHFTLAPARPEAEGSRIVLEAGFDATAVRLTGNVVGNAPFRGTLRHPGWKVTDVRLPRTTEGHDPRVIAAAEVEL
ncbi:DUF2760 domain-containing protein [Rhodoferax sp. WC2427]|uniref:DUF2760 domain-containing protein n=1 Tax=Rhodoferax sp. WC2427 TaxID=3234144 RepID=UPI003465F92A